MIRSLRTRLDKLTDGRESDAVVAALNILATSDSAPPGPAGDRAHDIWREAAAQDVDEAIRPLWCVMRATGRSLVEVMYPERCELR